MAVAYVHAKQFSHHRFNFRKSCVDLLHLSRGTTTSTSPGAWPCACVPDLRSQRAETTSGLRILLFCELEGCIRVHTTSENVKTVGLLCSMNTYVNGPFFFFFRAPESERKPLSTFISYLFLEVSCTGSNPVRSVLPPLSGLSLTVIKSVVYSEDVGT